MLQLSLLPFQTLSPSPLLSSSIQVATSYSPSYSYHLERFRDSLRVLDRNPLTFVHLGISRTSLDRPLLSGSARRLHQFDTLSVPSSGSMTPLCSQIRWHDGSVARDKRQSLLDQKGCIIWLTGLSGSGKSTVACTLDHSLASMGKLSYVLDGDNIRHGLSNNLGFSAADRDENIRRVGEVAKLFADAGLITLVSLISPYKRNRDFVRGLVRKGEFIEVYMKVPLEVCEGRDCKGLYKLARAGVLKGFTGVDDPYEKPDNPEIVLEATNAAGEFIPPEQMAKTLIDYLNENGFLQGPPLPSV